MKLKEIELKSFSQFIDQKIIFDPYVTIIIGKNDTGKTILLRRLLEQNLNFGPHITIDIPTLKGITKEQKKIEYIEKWTPLNEKEEEKIKRTLNYDNSINNITIKHVAFENILESKRPDVQLKIDDNQIEIFTETSNDKNWETTLNYQNFMNFFKPKILYTPLKEKQLIEYFFSFKLFKKEQKAGQIIETKTSGNREHIISEASLMKLTGWRFQVFKMDEKEEDIPKSSIISYEPLNIEIEEIDKKFKEISFKINKYLNKYWTENEDLKCEIYITGDTDSKRYQKAVNKYNAVIKLSDKNGSGYNSSGIKWFLSFIIEIISIDEMNEDMILLFDEPANHLHPAAQKSIINILHDFSFKHQIIYTTHSPFLIDWAFPQRIRLLNRDKTTKKTQIINKPYSNNKKNLNPWDSTRITLGIIEGDLGLLSEINLIVEGITDQIFLKNISLINRNNGEIFLPNEINIIPLGGENIPELKRIISILKTEKKYAILLYDHDEGGINLKNEAERHDIKCISINHDITNETKGYAIEDLFEQDYYLRHVIQYYSQFEWFHYNDEKDLLKTDFHPNKTITKRLEEFFKENLNGNDFSKTCIAFEICNNIIATNYQNHKFTELITNIYNKINEKR